MRYTAHTLDGSLVFEALTAQAIGDAVMAYGKENRRPYIAYTFDSHKPAFPYTTWQDEYGNYVGTQHRTFDDVVKAVRFK